MAQASPSTAAGTALVTGASSGIGYELSLLLARQGYALALVARSQAGLEGLVRRVRDDFGVPAFGYARDLSVANAPDELCSQLQRDGIAIDVLVNDAGFAIQGPFTENDATALLKMLQVNVTTLTQLTRLLLPGMIERGRGRILNISSIGAFMPGPMMAAYFASKAYVLSLSEALANELSGTGVTVTALCPGPTRSKFAMRAKLMETKAFRGTLMEASVVARQGFDAMMKGKRVVIPGFKHRMQLLPTPLVPRRLLAYFARQYHEVPRKNANPEAPWVTSPEVGQPRHATQP